jgi:predicted PurR-regulated permease PerM
MNRHAGLWFLLATSGFLAFLVLRTYWDFLFFAALFAIVFAPLNRRLAERAGKNAAAFVVTIGIILVLVVPTLYLISETVRQAPLAYQGVVATVENEHLRSVFGVTSDEIHAVVITLGEKLRENVLANAATYLGQASDIIVGIVIMFLTLFFLLRDGESFVKQLETSAPVGRARARAFFEKLDRVVLAIVFGQVVTAVVQGALVGILLGALGIPNALFWGFVATLLSVIPLFGPFLVYLPATAYLALQERYGAAIIMLAVGVLVISQIDNVLRPYVASRTANIHPLIPILGVIGGLKLWGFVGFIVGPLVLAAFVTLLSFVTTDNDAAGKRTGTA